MRNDSVSDEVRSELSRRLRTLHQNKEEIRHIRKIQVCDDGRELYDVVAYGTSAITSWLNGNERGIHIEIQERKIVLDDLEATRQNIEALNDFCFHHPKQTINFFRQNFQALEQERTLPELNSTYLKDIVNVLEYLATRKVPEAYRLLEQYSIPDTNRVFPLNELAIYISYALDELGKTAPTY